MMVTIMQLKKRSSFYKKILDLASAQPAIVSMAVLVIIGVLLYGTMFFNAVNIRNILRLSSTLAVLAMGLNVVILTGGIDLSGGAILALCGVIAAYLQNFGPVVMVAGALLIGLVAGAINGLLVAKVRIAPFIATLATQLGFRGIAYLSTEGAKSIMIDASSPFLLLSEGLNIFIFSVPFFIALALCGILTYCLKNRRFGRHVYAVGGNAEAAKMIGVQNDRIIIGSYMISGLTAALAGVLMAARAISGVPTSGQNTTLEAIAAVIIGGTILTGGKGKVSGALLGAIIFCMISNLINTYGDINAYVTNFITGTLVLLVALMQASVQRRKQYASKCSYDSVERSEKCES